MTDASIELNGTAVARDIPLGITLWRIAGPVARKVDVTWTGLYPNDTWSGPTVTYTRRRCAPGRLSVALSSDANLFIFPQRVVARSNGRVIGRVRLRPEGKALLSVPFRPAPGTTDCRVVYTVTPTAIPAEVTAGGNPDPRELGAHFDRFIYRPRR